MSSRSRERIGLGFSLRLALLYAAFFVVGSLGLLAGAYLIMERYVEEQERETILERVQEYSAWLRQGGLSALKARFSEKAALTKGISFVRLLAPGNHVLFVSLPEGTEAFHPEALDRLPLARGRLWLSFKDPAGSRTWTVASVSLPEGYILQVGKSSTRIHALLASLRSMFIWFVIPAVILGALGSGLLTFRAMHPLRSLISTVKDILETGRLSMRVPGGTDRGELQELVKLFNRMLEKNEALIHAMRQSLDNVAHDLRTPMTRLRGTAEMALSGTLDSGSCREALADCLEESDRVLRMLNTLMEVAEAETGTLRLEQRDIRVAEIFTSVADLYELVAEEKSIRVTCHCPQDLTIWADPTRLRQVIANLVDNAVKYSPEGSEVRLTALREKDRITLRVSDQGPGIPAGEIPKIWDRLYRGDSSRSKRGLGLGLSVVRAVVQAHGGSVEVMSAPGKGSTFILVFPENPATRGGESETT